MQVTVTFDSKLSQKIGSKSVVQVTAATVHEALFEVAVLYPALHLFNCDGELRSILRFAKNGTAVAVTEAVLDGDIIGLSIG